METSAMQRLTELEQRILDFESDIYPHPAAKQTAIFAEFGWSQTQYFYRLNFLLDEPAAMYYAPQTVARLRRLREARRALRCGVAPSRAHAGV
jgi:hypothetical protein